MWLCVCSTQKFHGCTNVSYASVGDPLSESANVYTSFYFRAGVDYIICVAFIDMSN